ncbi:hypothetical protein CEXT_30841 [Caerostris extrusa]|uniref:Uncharacterized protein n=1 Tax=Caerostris extrusa TaxID=172846 RepID=A0AAV4XRU3_CAEEX|nr:hypothetical protein CEXT_30841 [Caerostris extrusa]
MKYFCGMKYWFSLEVKAIFHICKFDHLHLKPIHTRVTEEASMRNIKLIKIDATFLRRIICSGKNIPHKLFFTECRPMGNHSVSCQSSPRLHFWNGMKTKREDTSLGDYFSLDSHYV